MTTRPYRLAAATIALLVAAPLFTACKNADQALDCGKRAISLTGDVQDLTDSALNVGQITDESRRKHTVAALKKVSDDIKQIRKDGDGKVDAAADKLSKAVDNAQTAVSKGKEPDFGPIGDAAGELTKACAGA
ncbi:hypothetical protein [Streptomyces sp. CBMA123]|uniref:hypothetical protein n=1 Tax=Streptomyces sp. CBMA123 TaxID=1896313 RepID=UPI0016619EAA|nr:hypothetical protein [Streptomyces sp. CBMA123]MBD0694157.1 hypothetical protein [Streptomyces sp. CBMA123]